MSCKTDKTNTKSDSPTSQPNPQQVNKADDFYPSWLKNANIYEVNIRQYTKEGTFNAFADHLPRLKKMGVDILWLMPIYPISKSKRKGTLGSYYAVSDYAKVNPEFGTLEDFQAMVDSIHAHNMKVILDFVPNHTGWDHTWITDHPEYYTQDKDGNIIDPQDPSTGESWGWTDVADLNFDNQDMRKAMIDDLTYWITDEGIDGYRMDVAHNVPDDFWDQVSDALFKVKKDIFMLAEAEAPVLRNSKNFHADYGWEFHHILNSIAKGEAGPKEVKAWYDKNQTTYSSGFHMQFTSNHDENSWNGTTKERMGVAHKALAALAFSMDGMPLIYGGQEEPLEKRLEFFEKDNIGFKSYAEADWYSRLLHAKHRNSAFWNGPFGGEVEFLHVDEQMLVFKRQKGKFIAYGLFNLTDKETTLEMPETIERFTNVLKKKVVSFKTGETVTMPAWGHMVLSSF